MMQMQMVAPMLMLLCCLCCSSSSVRTAGSIPTTPAASMASCMGLFTGGLGMLGGGLF